MDVKSAKEYVKEAKETLRDAKECLRVAQRQAKCKHKRKDRGGVFGQTCLDCKLFLNNGA